METNIIRYNLKDRGRRYRGKERNFNIAQIAAAINSPETQERVKNRDMHGFYGHWPRVKFGMIPNEGVMDGQDTAPRVIPAFITTYLQAFPDGTVEHRAEFIDTEPGQVAAKLHASKVGGFSSAIDEMNPRFFGFDYVLEPNFSTNRGYSLDSAAGMTLDDVEQAVRDEQLHAMSILLDSVNAERKAVSDVIERLQAENEELLSMLSSVKPDAAATLDSTAAGIRPLAVSKGPAERLRREASRFMGAHLLNFVEPEPAGDSKVRQEADRLTRRIIRG